MQGRSAYATSVDRRLVCAAPWRRRIWRVPAMATGSSPRSRVTRADGAPPQARVAKRLDPYRPVELASEAAIARFDLPEEFSAEACARRRPTASTSIRPKRRRRVDLRDAAAGHDRRRRTPRISTMRSTPSRTRSGFRAHRRHCRRQLLRAPGTALDAEARERGTSVYFPTRVIPMLPTRCRTGCARSSRTSIGCASSRT